MYLLFVLFFATRCRVVPKLSHLILSKKDMMPNTYDLGSNYRLRSQYVFDVNLVCVRIMCICVPKHFIVGISNREVHTFSWWEQFKMRLSCGTFTGRNIEDKGNRSSQNWFRRTIYWDQVPTSRNRLHFVWYQTIKLWLLPFLSFADRHYYFCYYINWRLGCTTRVVFFFFTRARCTVNNWPR